MRNLTLPVSIYLVATAAAVALVRVAGGRVGGEIGGAAIMAGAIIACAAVIRDGAYPRSRLVAGAVIVGGAVMIASLLHGDPVNNGLYAWLFVYLAGVSPACGPAWCRSGRVFVLVSLGYGALMNLLEVL